MSKINDLYNNLKATIVGTKTQKIDDKLDKITSDIVKYKSHSGRIGYIDLVRSVIAKSSMQGSITSGSGDLFGATQGGPAAFGQGRRIARYKTYEAIVSNINYAFRALNVLTDNILSPDDITKQSLEVSPLTFIEGESSSGVKEMGVPTMKRLIKTMKLENNLVSIIKNTLKYGDYFVELANAAVALTSNTILTEQGTYAAKFQTDVNEGYRIRIEAGDYNISLNMNSLRDDNVNGKNINEKNMSEDPVGKHNEDRSIQNIEYLYHKPSLVMKLQSALYPLCLGYLVFPDISLNANSAYSASSVEDQMVNGVCQNILKQIEDKFPQMAEFQNHEEVKDLIRHMIVNSANKEKALEIRYVPPDRIQHFKILSDKYYPYGESIFDHMQYTAKVVVALETALAIARLSRSTEKRKIGVEIGLPRDAKKIIEKMKEEFRKRKICLDDFGTVDTIPSMITTFEDVYIPQKDGKPFVDITTFSEGNIDVRGKTEEIKLMRDQLVAGLGVPPSFLAIEENLSNKAALSEENIIFARTVIGYQKYLNDQIRELLMKTMQIIDPDEALTVFDNVLVALPVPKSLQYEREARYTNEIVNLIESLERVGVPKEYSKKKYLTTFDWDAVKKYEIDANVEKTLDPTKKDEDDIAGAAGGFGGGQF
jgi:hypothetical protein